MNQCLLSNKCISLMVLSAYVYCTSLQRTDNAHVFSTQIQEGISLWWHPHQPLCWVLEHQIFARWIALWGEKVKALKSKQMLCKLHVLMNPSKLWITILLHHLYQTINFTTDSLCSINIKFYTCTELRLVQINSSSCSSLRVTTAWAGTLARWQVL